MTYAMTEGLVVVPPGTGEPRWIGTSRVTIKARAAQTSGGYGLILSDTSRGASPPMHIHHTADEAMWIISGRVRVRCGEDEFTLESGGFALLPRGVPHTFLTVEDATMLGLLTPGGTEAFFDAGPVATSPAPPPIDMQRLQRAAQENECEFVGPPMTLDG
jgi:quercetin dioxygenase-like cupin family protein